VLLAVAMGCGQNTEPVAPTPAPPVTGAAADGSTLKATAPTPLEPVGGIRTETLAPEFVIENSSGLFTEATFEYRIELQDLDGGFPTPPARLASGPDGRTRWELPILLDTDTPYRWRARAELSGAFGPWSEFADFITIDYQGIVPRPPGGVWPSDGPAVLAYIGSVFPEYTAPVNSLSERDENTEFLRDRIIEAGICGGLDLARNLKRGVGPHSIDAFAWAVDGDVEVVDFAIAYDDYFDSMVLLWQIVEGPAGYDPLPDHPGC
jgi:hypothetical protein